MPEAALSKATHRGTRRSNERLVLRTICDEGPLSRADVARATDLTRTTVSDLVEGLFGDGLVVEAGTGPSTGGKAPILLRVPADARQLIGVDVDRDRLSGVVIDLRGDVCVREARELSDHDGTAALQELWPRRAHYQAELARSEAELALIEVPPLALAMVLSFTAVLAGGILVGIGSLCTHMDRWGAIATLVEQVIEYFVFPQVTETHISSLVLPKWWK